jgi:triosephosphate isomerase
VIGNWKMNPATVGEARKLFLDLRKELGRKQRQAVIVVAPPSPFISEIERLNPSQRIALAGQDIFFETTGAYTGEVSLPMLKSVGATAVIVGHSERRAAGETDESIYKDILSIIKSNVTAIVCVGEKERDLNGNYYSMVEAQLRSALKAVPKTKLKQLVIAYEPVWAIGSGKTATPEDVYEMKLFIQKVIVGQYGRPALKTVRIIYGGSVKKENASELMAIGKVDGFLVGGASLKAKEFVAIIDSAESYVK